MLRTYLYKLHGINYKESLFIQQRLQNDLIKDNSVKQFLIYANYKDHIYTQGKHGKKNNLLIDKEKMEKLHLNYFETDRGGDITYHGPGQIVFYPVFNLKLLGLGVKKYVNRIEFLLCKFLKEFDISSHTIESRPGIWVGDKKIASIGVNVKRHITKHGFALNVNNDLGYFNYINPCGFNGLKITSLENEINKKIEIDECLERLIFLMEQLFNIEIIESDTNAMQDNRLI